MKHIHLSHKKRWVFKQRPRDFLLWLSYKRCVCHAGLGVGYKNLSDHAAAAPLAEVTAQLEIDRICIGHYNAMTSDSDYLDGLAHRFFLVLRLPMN